MSDAVTSARQTDHGRDQEQHDRDKEDRFGDFDGYSGDAAEAQNASDQGDYQKRNDPAQHGQDLRFRLSVSSSARRERSRIGCRNNPAREQKFRVIRDAETARNAAVGGTNTKNRRGQA
jgi:hypothetical protein